MNMSVATMGVELEQNDGATVIYVRGDLDAAGVPRFEEVTAAVTDDMSDVTVDLRPAHFVDSAGLGAILRLDRRLSDTTVVVAVDQPWLLRIFHVTGLDNVLTVRSGRDGAAP